MEIPEEFGNLRRKIWEWKGQESYKEFKVENRATTKQPLSLGRLAQRGHNEGFPAMDL